MNRLSLRAAIDAKCKSCIHDPGSGGGGWREQVAACSSSNCPLHSVRPLPVKAANPVAQRQGGAASGIGSINCAQARMAPKNGLNDHGAGERRAT